MRTITLLLLSGGGHTGSNVMAVLATRRTGLRLIATSNVPDEPALFNFDAVYLAPTLALDMHAFEQRILEVIACEQPDLVVPCRDEEVEWLAGLGERRPDLSARFLCGARQIAEMANDKWLSFEFSSVTLRRGRSRRRRSATSCNAGSARASWRASERCTTIENLVPARRDQDPNHLVAAQDRARMHEQRLERSHRWTPNPSPPRRSIFPRCCRKPNK